MLASTHLMQVGNQGRREGCFLGMGPGMEFPGFLTSKDGDFWWLFCSLPRKNRGIRTTELTSTFRWQQSGNGISEDDFGCMEHIKDLELGYGDLSCIAVV